MQYRQYPGIPGRKVVARLTALLFAVSLFVQPVAVSAAAQIINIANPNAAGVSHNQYVQFNVGADGLVLNNSTGSTSTTLAGTIAGNANLTGGPARIILNEVTGTGVSQINGLIEVAGQRAAVIIANPNGITVNGGGFINASRAVLTTGKPVFGGSGSLSSFRVTGGQITVEGAGLDATGADRVDLISRSIAVNAAVNANEINAVAGANKVNYNTLAATAISGTGTAPAVAIDVGVLGGMYAGKISLVSTERGVGVNSAGVLKATAGNIVIASNGKVTLANSTTAKGAITVSGTAIDLSGGIMDAGGNVAFKASSGDITNTNYGMVTAGGDVAVTTPGSFINSTGSINAGGAFAITAASVYNTDYGTLSSVGNFAINLGSAGGYYGLSKCSGGGSAPTVSSGPYTLDNTDGFINAGGDLTINVKTKAVKATTSNPVFAVNNTNGQMSAGNNLTINVTAASGKSICGTPPGTVYAVNNANGYMSAGNDLIIKAKDGTNGNSYGSKCGSSYYYHPVSTTKTNYLVDNTNGYMSAGNDITITVQGAVKTQSYHYGASRCGSHNGNTTTTAQLTVNNTGGYISAGNNLVIDTKGIVNNAGGELTATNTAITANDVQNAAGTINGDASVTIKTNKAFDTTAGTVTGGTITIPNQI